MCYLDSQSRLQYIHPCKSSRTNQHCSCKTHSRYKYPFSAHIHRHLRNRKEESINLLGSLNKYLYLTSLQREFSDSSWINKWNKYRRWKKQNKKTLIYESPLAGSRPAPEFRSGSEKLKSLPSVKSRKILTRLEDLNSGTLGLNLAPVTTWPFWLVQVTQLNILYYVFYCTTCALTKGR